MPRHDRAKTPPEKRRAPKGTATHPVAFAFTAEDEERVEQLVTLWGVNRSEAVRRAVKDAVEREERR